MGTIVRTRRSDNIESMNGFGSLIGARKVRTRLENATVSTFLPLGLAIVQTRRKERESGFNEKLTVYWHISFRGSYKQRRLAENDGV